MKLKKIITLFCLLVLGIQVLPVQQIGSLLFSNSFQEEIPHSFDVEKNVKVKFPIKPDPFLPSACAGVPALKAVMPFYLHFAESLPALHPGEIHTPPPNA